jgi:ubiquinone/menaquinone biosynthesis C-methylase UbiE
MKTFKSFQRDESSVNSVMDIVFGYQRSRVLLSAFELDLFSAIGTDEKTAKEVAMYLDTDAQATERLMNALCAMELLEKTGNKFSNSKVALRYLVKSKPEFMSNLKHYNYLWTTWSTLTESVRKGTAVYPQDASTMSQDRIEALVEAMNWRAKWMAADTAKSIDLSHTNALLDLGCGSGLYAMEFKNAKPSMKVTVFDLPNVVPITKKYLREDGFANKIEVLEGDFRYDSFGKGYDLIFLSYVVHMYSIWENIDLMRKVYDALTPRGTVVINEFIIGDDRTSPDFHTLFSLNMLVNMRSGDIYSYSDVWVALKEAWFSTIEKKETDFGSSLVIAKK